MRINIINPKYLTDQHLIHEYSGIKMSPHHYRKSLRSKAGIIKSKISPRYVLNKGHAYMWYDKFGYVLRRFDAIVEEMRRRGFKTDSVDMDFHAIDDIEAYGEFCPNQDDLDLNMERIMDKINSKPGWYKYEGRQINDWDKFYENLYKEGSLIWK